MLAVAIAVAIGQVPDAVTNEAVKAFDEGGYKAVAIVGLVGCAAVGALAFWLIKALVAHLKAGADIALEQAKADVRTGDRLTAIENGLRAKGIIT